MEYQFENVQHYNRKMRLEFNYKIYCRLALLYGTIMGVITAVYVSMAINQAPIYWIAVIASLGFVVHYFTWPYRLEIKQRKRWEKYYDGLDEPAYLRFGDKIYAEDSNSTYTVEYRKIEKVIVLKHGIFLRHAEKAYLCVDPNCFTKGTCGEFMEFLREKCPNLKIPN